MLVLGAGFHFKIPFFDVVYVQSTTLRTATLSGAIGYTVMDIHAFVRTYRLITDTKWGSERIRLDERVH